MQPRSARSFIEVARRDQIMAAAIATIADEGFVRMSFTRIASRAGISPGLITYHFKTKDELVKAVWESVNSRLDAAMADRAEGAESYCAALESMLIGFVHYCARHPDEMKALGEIEGAAGSAQIRAIADQNRESGIAELEGMFREGQEAGEYREFATRPMAVALIAAMAATPGELGQDGGSDPDEFATELAALFVQAVRAGPVT